MGPWGYIALAYGLAAVTLAGYGWSLALRIRRQRERLDRERTEQVGAVP
ncbi:MAG: hypothetical protein ACE5G5_06045 [Candidatus Methylomirabilales bacterium]